MTALGALLRVKPLTGCCWSTCFNFAVMYKLRVRHIASGGVLLPCSTWPSGSLFSNHHTFSPDAAAFHSKNRDLRLNTMGNRGVDHRVIMFQPRFVRLLLNTVREDARPGDRKAVTFETYLCKQGDIFLKTVIVSDALVVRIGVIFAIQNEIEIR